MRRNQRHRKTPARFEGYDLSGGIAQRGDDEPVDEEDEPPGLLGNEGVDSEVEEEEDDVQGGAQGAPHGGPVIEPIAVAAADVDPAIQNIDFLLEALGDVQHQPDASQGSQGTQPHTVTQAPDAASLPSLQEAHGTYIPTHKWPPKSTRPEYIRALTSLWQRLASNPGDESLWVLEAIFQRAIIPAGQGPDLGDPMSQAKKIKERLRRWQAGECGELWNEAVAGYQPKEKPKKKGKGKKRAGETSEQTSQEQRNAMRSKSFAQAGQYTKAIQALVSNGIAEYTPATLAEMQSKHPAPFRPQPPLPSTDVPAQAFGGSEVSKAALSFKKGTAAGPSGMRPEHLISVLKSNSATLAEKALVALTKLVNVMAAGKVPNQVRPYLCGARLHAGKKKDSSLRPIAVGNLMRRLVAKCFSSALASQAAALLKPHQLGVGVRGGAEAVAHAVSEAIGDDPTRWVLQSDLINAYNLVDRGVVLKETARHFPQLLAWAKTCYGSPSHLKFGASTILSLTGVHQGDPLAGLLFCLALKPVIDAIKEEVPTLALNTCYLDDAHHVGTLEELSKVVDIIVREGTPRGLILSTAATVQPPSLPKTTVWSPMDVAGETEPDPLQRGIPKVRGTEGIVVLGAPVGYRAFTKAKLEERVEKVRQVTELLPLLQDPHSEFVLLRSCLGLPKVMFMLRAVNTTDHQEVLSKYDSITRGALSRILGTPVSDTQWAQSKLPVAMGGLGLRAASDHASVAYATSFLSAQTLLDDLLGQGEDGEPEPASLPQPLLDNISEKQGEDVIVESLIGMSQQMASLKVDQKNQSFLSNLLAEEGDDREIARMSSLGLPHAGGFLSVVPSPPLGLHLRSAEFIPVIKYRLGIPVYSSEGPCPACNAISDCMGDHALGCSKTGDRIARHNLVRDVVFEAAASADLAPSKEEPHLLPGSAARPGDILIRRWYNGKDAAIDVTVTSPLSPSNVLGAAREAGKALTKAFDRKMRDTAEACRTQGLQFFPLAVETLGGFHSVACGQVKQLGQALARKKGCDEREPTSQLFSRISITLMRGNALMLSSRSPDFAAAEVDGVE